MKFPRPQRLLGFALAAAVIGFIGISTFFAWQFTGPVRRERTEKAERFLSSGYETATFRASDGLKLSGWFVPCANSRTAVVLLHGHGSDRTQMLARARFFHDQGYAVLLYDARGHGQSEGAHISFGWFEVQDLLGALDWLRSRGFHDFGCLGSSQGGATIVLAASRLKDVRWSVLESVYPTLKNAIDRRFHHVFGVPGWLAGSLMISIAEWRLGASASEISPMAHIAELSCPVLVISGSVDTNTRPEDARELFDRASEPKSFWLVPGAAHVDLYGFAKQDYEQHLLSFIATAH